jgi:hypothetical protein
MIWLIAFLCFAIALAGFLAANAASMASRQVTWFESDFPFYVFVVFMVAAIDLMGIGAWHLVT